MNIKISCWRRMKREKARPNSIYVTGGDLVNKDYILIGCMRQKTKNGLYSLGCGAYISSEVEALLDSVYMENKYDSLYGKLEIIDREAAHNRYLYNIGYVLKFKSHKDMVNFKIRYM